MANLRKQIVRLAHAQPRFRSELLGVLQGSKTASCEQEWAHKIRNAPTLQAKLETFLDAGDDGCVGPKNIEALNEYMAGSAFLKEFGPLESDAPIFEAFLKLSKLLTVVQKDVENIDKYNAFKKFIKSFILKHLVSYAKQGSSGAKRATINDENTLSQLIDMEAESMFGDDRGETELTPQVENAAAKFDDVTEKELLAWVKAHMDVFDFGDNPDAQKIVSVLMHARGGAGYLYFQEMEGAGVGTWDGDWDRFFVDPKKTIEELSEHMKGKLQGVYAALKDAIERAADVAGDKNIDRTAARVAKMAASDEALWLRVGSQGDYENHGGDFLSVAETLGMFNVTEVEQWHKGGFTADGFEGKNYISFYWGDAEGNLVRDLNAVERVKLAAALKKYNKGKMAAAAGKKTAGAKKQVTPWMYVISKNPAGRGYMVTLGDPTKLGSKVVFRDSTDAAKEELKSWLLDRVGKKISQNHIIDLTGQKLVPAVWTDFFIQTLSDKKKAELGLGASKTAADKHPDKLEVGEHINYNNREHEITKVDKSEPEGFVVYGPRHFFKEVKNGKPSGEEIRTILGLDPAYKGLWKGKTAAITPFSSLSVEDILETLRQLERKNPYGYDQLTEQWRDSLPHTGKQDILKGPKFEEWLEDELLALYEPDGHSQINDFLDDMETMAAVKPDRS